MIVITGASDGLGKELTKLYEDEGMNTIGVSRSRSGHASISVVADLTEPDQVSKAAEEIESQKESIDAIVLCAGMLSVSELEAVDPRDVAKVFSVNIESQIQLISGLMKRIKADKTDIVLVSSTVGTKGYVEQAAYGASKWAVRGFAKNLQAEFKSLPNRVVSFCPGGFETDLFKKAVGEYNLADKGGWMKPIDVARLIKQILELPSNMEVSEIIVNRKTVSDSPYSR